MRKLLMFASAGLVLSSLALAFISNLDPMNQSAQTVASYDGEAGCKNVEAAVVMKISPQATFSMEGAISGDLEGMVSFTGDEGSLGQSMPAPIQAGVTEPLRIAFPYAGGLTVDTPDGKLVMRSVGVFEPGSGGLNSQFNRAMPEFGTGRFSGATGHIFLTLLAGKSQESITGEARGVLC